MADESLATAKYLCNIPKKKSLKYLYCKRCLRFQEATIELLELDLRMKHF